MSHARALLIVLIVLRLLMPPGICACKWSSPAARLLVAFLQSERDIPNPDDPNDKDDDHEPGCPASPLAAGMGVVPPSEPSLPPSLSLDMPLPPLVVSSHFAVATQTAVPIRFETPPNPLYLTQCALLM